jgi:hypothetical protein
MKNNSKLSRLILPLALARVLKQVQPIQLATIAQREPSAIILRGKRVGIRLLAPLHLRNVLQMSGSVK